MSGFDCKDYYREPSYLVVVPKTVREDVQAYEVFGREPNRNEREWSPDCVLRAVVTKPKWDVVSGEIRLEFNKRLKAERKKTGSWSQGNNGVQRLLGKEMLVLLWAIEPIDVTIEQCEVAIRNWLGLKPEERWWLYTMTAAATGMASQVGVGWRAALTKALCFGTKLEAFSLRTIGDQGRLPPRKNEAHDPNSTARVKVTPGIVAALAHA